MALNEVCDAPVDQGVPMYRRFLKPPYIAALPPAQVAIVRQLETAIDELVHCPLFLPKVGQGTLLTRAVPVLRTTGHHHRALSQAARPGRAARHALLPRDT